MLQELPKINRPDGVAALRRRRYQLEPDFRELAPNCCIQVLLEASGFEAALGSRFFKKVDHCRACDKLLQTADVDWCGGGHVEATVTAVAGFAAKLLADDF